MFKKIGINRPSSGLKVIFNQPFYRLLGILSVLALIKLVVASQFDLDSEEAQYWIWSNHLQLSYYSKPPLVAYLNWFSTSIFGDNVLGIRINAVIIGSLISVVSYLLAYEVFKDLNTALLAAVLTNIFPFLLHNSLFFKPDTPLLLFWLCAMLFYWKAVETRKSLWWWLFGLSIGLGALSKYSIFLIYIPLGLFSWKYHREIFKSRSLYFSIFIALLLFSPVIYWNIQQKGVGLFHLIHLTGVNDHTHSGWEVMSNILEFVSGQILIVLPFYEYRTIFRKFKQNTLTKEEEFLILPAICIFTIFLMVAIIRRSGVYINWAMFAYTGVPILFSYYTLNGNNLKLNRLVAIGMTVGSILFIGLTSPANKILPLGKINPAIKMIGWSQLASKVDSLKDDLATRDCYVISTNYHITSELYFYLDGQPETYFLNVNSRMTQFDLWQRTEQLINTEKLGILVDYGKITPEIKDCFNAILKEDSLVIINKNCDLETYYIYITQGMKGTPKQYSSY